uniref:Uncharacterized protein n=1 Tax=Sparus aurata TaxID=8175 RepID=A0A671X7I3_SPAAU
MCLCYLQQQMSPSKNNSNRRPMKGREGIRSKLRDLKGFKSDPEFARFLLDRYVNFISFMKCIAERSLHTAEDMTGNGTRERGRDMWQRVPRPGLELRATAARTKPLYVGHPVYQLS